MMQSGRSDIGAISIFYEEALVYTGLPNPGAPEGLIRSNWEGGVVSDDQTMNVSRDTEPPRVAVLYHRHGKKLAIFVYLF